MIRYSLKCRKGHAFDGWFASSDAFDAQAARKQLICPSCGSKSVTKALMAPRVVRSAEKSASKRRRSAAAEREAAPTPAETPAGPASDAAVPAVSAPPDAAQAAMHREMRTLMRKLRTEVLAKSEYVGPRFPEEARKMHHEETPARGIYGEATPDEARALQEEGIDFLPLPVLPEDHN